jgi:APA family basic amino acid/polyamine antiporter
MSSELKRRLGLGSATALVVGEVIGVGIFLTPAGMAKVLASPLWLMIVWLTMGVITLCGALCLGELAARVPTAGGLYVYLRETFGPGTAFLFGWMSLLVMDPGLTALLATGIATYLGQVFTLSTVASRGVALVTILLLAVVNILGVRFGAAVLRGLTALKLAFLAGVVCWGFAGGHGAWSHFTPFVDRVSGSPPLVEALAGGLISAFFSFAGWWDACKMTGELRDPQRTMPRALAFGIAIVAAVYLAVSAVFLYLLPVKEVVDSETFAAQAGEVMFGPAGRVIFSLIVVVVVLGTLASFSMGAPRVYYAMARDGLFWPAVAQVHARFGTPTRAIAIQAFLGCLLVLSGTFEQILAYFFFVVVAFLALTIAGLFRLRLRSLTMPAYSTPGYPITPLLFLLPIAVVLVLLAMDNPTRAALGVAVVALGILVYGLFFRDRIANEKRGPWASLPGHLRCESRPSEDR